MSEQLTQVSHPLKPPQKQDTVAETLTSYTGVTRGGFEVVSKWFRSGFEVVSKWFRNGFEMPLSYTGATQAEDTPIQSIEMPKPGRKS